MVDQIRLGKLAELYPKLNLYFEIYGYLQTIIHNKYSKEHVEEAFLKLEEILKGDK